MNVLDEIGRIRKDVFSGRGEECIPLVLKVAETAEKMILPEDRSNFNEVLNLINISLMNKDYLLLADVLKFEIKPLIVKTIQ